MSPRILPLKHCPRCREPLPKPPPRVCENCGASIQHRYLSWGCLTSAPPVLLAAAALGWLARML